MVMPINGYYFCHLDCVRTYNAHVANLGADTVMPDDGPGSEPFDSFLLPERRRPDCAIEARVEDEALDEDKQEFDADAEDEPTVNKLGAEDEERAEGAK